MDVLLLSRIQFALTVGVHYIFPPLSIGLGLLLVIMEALWLKTRNPLYHQMARFWVRVFALTFAVGVATGIVMEFEFGTNWATYSRYVGDVFGSPLAAEGVFAFFLESSFLGVLIFGWDKIGPRLHFFSTCMVCLGAHLSALWIIVANSWMQTPAGYKIVEGPAGPRAEITSFWEMVFNPSTVDRFSHAVLGAWMAGAFLVISISAWYLLKKRHLDFARASLKVGLGLALVASLLQLGSGHHSAVGVAKNQPAKMAAFEGLYQTQPRAPLAIMGWVDEKNERVIGLPVPGLLSILVHNDINKPVTGLRDIPADERPPVNLTFQFYHLMIGVGTTLMGLAVLGAFLMWRGKLEDKRWLLWLLVLSSLGPQIANQAGWFAAEVGRQPWIVQGVLKTSQGLSKVVKAEAVLTSIILFGIVYLLLVTVFLYLLNDKIKHGPDPADLTPSGKLAAS